MRRMLLSCVLAHLPVGTAGLVGQDCPAGPADQTFHLTQDTLPVQVAEAFPGVETLLRELGYEVEVADAQASLFRTVPTAHRPRLAIMEQLNEFDPRCSRSPSR